MLFMGYLRRGDSTRSPQAGIVFAQQGGPFRLGQEVLANQQTDELVQDVALVAMERLVAGRRGLLHQRLHFAAELAHPRLENLELVGCDLSEGDSHAHPGVGINHRRLHLEGPPGIDQAQRYRRPHRERVNGVHIASTQAQIARASCDLRLRPEFDNLRSGREGKTGVGAVLLGLGIECGGGMHLGNNRIGAGNGLLWTVWHSSTFDFAHLDPAANGEVQSAVGALVAAPRGKWKG